MTKFDRATKGNEDGKKVIKDALDPLKQKNIMLRKSMLTKLKLKAFVDNVSESEVVRIALKNAL